TGRCGPCGSSGPTEKKNAVLSRGSAPRAVALSWANSTGIRALAAGGFGGKDALRVRPEDELGVLLGHEAARDGVAHARASDGDVVARERPVGAEEHLVGARAPDGLADHLRRLPGGVHVDVGELDGEVDRGVG